MKQVIGYYEKTFDDKFLLKYNLNPNDLLGVKLQKCSGRAIDSKTIRKSDKFDDIIDEMVSANIGTLKRYDEITKIAEIIFGNPMPEDVFLNYYSNKQPIYK